MSLRIKKINSLIREQMAEIISRELDLKSGVFLTIPKVDTSKDLRYTHISISVFPEKNIHYAEETLRKEKSLLQKKLHQRLHLKILPKIDFRIDTTEAEADQIEKIIKSF